MVTVQQYFGGVALLLSGFYKPQIPRQRRRRLVALVLQYPHRVVVEGGVRKAERSSSKPTLFAFMPCRRGYGLVPVGTVPSKGFPQSNQVPAIQQLLAQRLVR